LLAARIGIASIGGLMNASSPAVTWLMPVKNAMPYLPATLESIRAQTYANHEILVWENGSTDGTIEELQRWIPERIPGRIVTGQPSSVGLSRAELVKLATTDLCACIDGDDINHHGRLETEVAFMQKHPDIAMVGSQVTRIDETGAEQGQYAELPTDAAGIIHRMLYSWTFWQPTVLFRRAAVLEAGNYRDIRHEDYDLWLRLASRYPLANLPMPLLKYRVHGKNLTTAIPATEADQAMNRAFIEAAPTLFGCTEAEADALRNKRDAFAFPLLRKIAAHLDLLLGNEGGGQLHSKTFLEACEKVVRRRDVVSRMLISALTLTAHKND
jgi:hypothetical protein